MLGGFLARLLGGLLLLLLLLPIGLGPEHLVRGMCGDGSSRRWPGGHVVHWDVASGLKIANGRRPRAVGRAVRNDVFQFPDAGLVGMRRVVVKDRQTNQAANRCQKYQCRDGGPDGVDSDPDPVPLAATSMGLGVDDGLVHRQCQRRGGQNHGGVHGE